MAYLPIGPKTKAFAVPFTFATDEGGLPAGSAALGTVGLTAGTASIGSLAAGTAEIGKLGAGTALIGKVGIDQTTAGTTDSVTVKPAAYGSRQSAARPADTTAYTAGDCVGAAITFPVGPTGGGEVIITSVSLEVDVTAVPSGMTSFNLQLYNVTPPSALADNAAWDLPAGDRTAYLGVVPILTPVDVGSTLYIEGNTCKQITLLSANLFAYLVTVGGYTPSSAAVKAVTVHTLRP